MIFVMVMQEFDNKLAEISNLVSTMERDNYHFEKKAIAMVGNLEEKAEKYALPIQGELALIRGRLVCGYSEAKANTLSRKDRGRERQRYTLEQLSDAVMLVEEYFRAARKQFEECEQICGQIIINAYYKGMNRQGQDLYLQVSQDAELAPYLAKVQGVVGCANSRVIFEQAKGYIK